ncbi:MAG: glycosyltransferase [Microthrixaceae bacterium]
MLNVLWVLTGWAIGWWLFGRPNQLRVERPEDGVVQLGVADLSIIIPARNESASLPNLLADLERARPIGSEVIVVDDSSSDDTLAIARGFEGVSTFSAGLTPPGWLGKAWACHVGAVASSGSTLLFLDADVRIEPGAIESVLHELDVRGGLVSVEPYHSVERPYEQVSALFGVVAFMGIGAGGPGPSTGAFGPVMATGRADYELVGGHRAVRSDVVEDMALARRFTEHDRSVTVLTGGPALRFRMYPSGFASLVEGWTKNFATGAGNTPIRRLLGAILWLIAMGSATMTLLGSFTDLAALAVSTGLYAAFAFQLRSMFARLGNFSALAAILFPLQLAVFFAVFFRSLWFTLVRRKVRWRGRDIPLNASATSSDEAVR